MRRAAVRDQLSYAVASHVHIGGWFDIDSSEYCSQTHDAGTLPVPLYATLLHFSLHKLMSWHVHVQLCVLYHRPCEQSWSS